MAVDLTKIDQVKLPVRPLHPLLGPEDKVHLEAVIARLPVIEDIIHRAARSGIDVQAHADRHNMHETIARRMYDAHFPVELPAVQG
jgi:hypothetical protein